MQTFDVNLNFVQPVSAISITSLSRSDGLLLSGVSLPLVMTNTSGDMKSWFVSFADPSPPPFYNGQATVTPIGGGSDLFDLLPMYPDTSAPGGLWCTVYKYQNKHNIDNFSKWFATKSAPDTIDENQVAQAIADADADILLRFQTANLVPPATSIYLASIEAELINCYGYVANGVADEDKAKGPFGKLTPAYDRAIGQLNRLLNSPNQSFAQTANPAVVAADPQRSAVLQGRYFPVRPAVPALRPWWTGGWVR